MRFPFPDDIGMLLRAQFTHDRLATTSRNLGNSSITKGDGSLELRLTDDGPAQVAMGDLPDGGFGLGVLSAGQLVSIQSWVQAQIAATNQALSDRLDAHDERMGAVENRMAAAEDRLDSHASRIGAAETAISGLQSRMTTAEGRLDSHVSRIGALENRVDAAENQITGTTAKNTEQDVRLNKIDNRLNALDGGGGTIPP